ncbi:acetyl esterase [Arboricoccus pini]|uniref:Acetyl esterase n=1 Tax=Arboricoccus pini TaxID=1963835 RepID=A0A212RRH3_9PROT|nr:alpha/beta hydrolase [Arboricoccus pini]SNB75210.1 acetyl esterase [Arboricoccus pini]
MSIIGKTVAAAALLAVTSGAALAAPVLEPATQAFIDALAKGGGAPIYQLSPADARNVLAGAQAGKVAKPAVDIEDTSFPVGPTGKVAIRIVRPQHAKGDLPAVIYLHGGGWVLGDKNTHDRLVRELADKTKAAIVFVDYDRSPEAKFPVAIEQAYAAAVHIQDHARSLGIDPTRLAVAGDSVGGNMAAALTLLAKERHGPRFLSQVLFYPVTDANFDNGSYQTFADGPWLTKPAMEWFWNAYLPDASARQNPIATPLNATIEQLRGLPPALVVTDENDVLRDEGEAYARKLAAAGVRVTSTRYNGTIHDFVMLNALAATPASEAAIDQAATVLRQAFAR